MTKIQFSRQCCLATWVVILITLLFLLVMAILSLDKMECYSDSKSLMDIPPIPRLPEVEDLPIVVTAAHVNNFHMSIRMLHTLFVNLTLEHPGISVIFYDLGLTEEQNETLYDKFQGVNIEIRRFPFSEYPSLIQRIYTGGIKPVIVHRVLEDNDFVMWVSPSLRFHSAGDLTALFRKARSSSGTLVLAGDGLLLKKATTQMVKMSIEDESVYYVYGRQIDTDWMIFSRHGNMIETVIIPWVTCAMNRKCFFSKETVKAHPCRGYLAGKYGCDIDRSVLATILYKNHEGCSASYMFSPSDVKYDMAFCDPIYTGPTAYSP